MGKLTQMDLSERSVRTGRHPWEITRSDFFRRLIASSVDLQGISTLLDIGAGDGWFAGELLADLPDSTSVTCWDINYTSDDLNSLLPVAIERTTVQPQGRFDLVLLMDVLEHIDDDAAFLRETVIPLLDPDGVLVVSVPAHPRLFTAHDTMLGHHRRYRPAAIRQLLGEHLQIVSDGPLFISLTVVRGLQAIVERVRGPHVEAQQGIGGWQYGTRLANAICASLAADARLGMAASTHGLHLPGLSYWAVCRPTP